MRRSLTLLVGLSLVLSSLVAGAQAPPPQQAPPPAQQMEDPASLESAKIHFQQGVALYNDGNFNAALAEFLEAYRLRRSPGVLYNIGLTQKSLFRYGEAIESLQKYLAEGQNLTPERQAEVAQLITEMHALLADVTFAVEPQGAAIAVDGRTMGQSPLSRPVGIAAGNHVVEVTAEGFKPARKEVLVSAGVPMSLTFKLELIPHTGKVHITASQPMATVIIDGKTIGPAPVDVELALGGHQLEVAAPRYIVYRSELVVAAGQTREVSAMLELPVQRVPIYKKWYLWTPVAVILAGAAVGLGVGLSQRPQPLEGTLSPGVGNVN